MHPFEDPKDKYASYLKLSDFTLFKAKNDGINAGGFYRDPCQQSWLLKEGHSFIDDCVIKEYVAGSIFQLLLGNNAPQTEIVINDMNGSLLLGSKLLTGFKTLSDLTEFEYRQWRQQEMAENPYETSPQNFSMSFNNKPISGFMEGIAAISFLKDTDAHYGNVGLIDHGDYYSFAKIDHGFSFSFSYDNSVSLDNLRSELHEHYQNTDLNVIGFDAVYQSVNHIASLDFANIEKIVNEKMTIAKSYLVAVDHEDPTNFNDFQQDLLFHLKEQHLGYQKMAHFMLLEKGIIEHNDSLVFDIMDTGINLNQPFKPFYNPIFNDDSFMREINSVETKGVTGMELARTHWPELLNVVLSMDDVLTAEGIGQTKVEMSISTPEHSIINSSLPHNIPVIPHQEITFSEFA